METVGLHKEERGRKRLTARKRADRGLAVGDGTAEAAPITNQEACAAWISLGDLKSGCIPHDGSGVPFEEVSTVATSQTKAWNLNHLWRDCRRRACKATWAIGGA